MRGSSGVAPKKEVRFHFFYEENKVHVKGVIKSNYSGKCQISAAADSHAQHLDSPTKPLLYCIVTISIITIATGCKETHLTEVSESIWTPQRGKKKEKERQTVGVKMKNPQGHLSTGSLCVQDGARRFMFTFKASM